MNTYFIKGFALSLLLLNPALASDTEEDAEQQTLPCSGLFESMAFDGGYPTAVYPSPTPIDEALTPRFVLSPAEKALREKQAHRGFSNYSALDSQAFSPNDPNINSETKSMAALVRQGRIALEQWEAGGDLTQLLQTVQSLEDSMTRGDENARSPLMNLLERSIKTLHGKINDESIETKEIWLRMQKRLQELQVIPAEAEEKPAAAAPTSPKSQKKQKFLGFFKRKS